MRTFWLVFFLALSMLANPLSAQDVKASDVVVIEGKSFILHDVLKGETLYSISKKYNVEQKDLLGANPQLVQGLKEGDRLRVPYNKGTAQPASGTNSKAYDKIAFDFHVAKKSETVYSIARQYGVSVETIYRFNPESRKGLLENEVIRIPKNFKETEDNGLLSEDSQYYFHTVQPKETPYAVSRRYQITVQELISHNPRAAERFVEGMLLKIPKQKQELMTANVFSHIVKPGETLSSLSREYNISLNDLRELNPELNDRVLIIGETVRIPKGKAEKNQIANGVQSTNKVVASVESNKLPVAGSGFKAVTSDTFRISMFLPLYYDLNEKQNMRKLTNKEIRALDSLRFVDREAWSKHFVVKYNEITRKQDTLLIESSIGEKQRSLYANSRPFVYFYQGFLIALDSMQKAGAKVKLTLYDDQYNQQVVESILRSHDLINSDLIVGPVDIRLQRSISAFSAKNQIPMVSPFLPDDDHINNNPFYFQVNPTRRYVMTKTADVIGDSFSGKNFIIMTLGKVDGLAELGLAKIVKEKFYKSGKYRTIDDVKIPQIDFTEGGEAGYWRIKNVLHPDKENVILAIATENRSEREAILSRAINSLQVLSSEFNITLVGSRDYPLFKSINTEYYHRLNLHYLIPDYVDYNSEHTKQFIHKYRQAFNNEPDQYSFRGYDIATYFIGAFSHYGKHFAEYTSKYSPVLLQSSFDFKKVNMLSGYMNHGLYFMNFTPGYEVKMISKVEK